jgi:hypothetical protein
MSEAFYRKEIRGAFRGAWSGAFDLDAFFDVMFAVIDFGLRQAFLEGMRECGFSSIDELDVGERAELTKAIINERRWIARAAAFIEDHSKAKGGKLRTVLARAKLWGNRWLDVKNRARQLTCGNRKLRWVLGATEKHCPDCSKYAGRVYRARTWAKWDIRPQHRGLACCGYNCDCRLEDTDAPLNKGRPPAKSGCGSRRNR